MGVFKQNSGYLRGRGWERAMGKGGQQFGDGWKLGFGDGHDGVYTAVKIQYCTYQTYMMS